MNYRRIFSLAAMGAVISGCSSQAAKEPVNRDIFAMDTFMTMTVYGDGSGLDEAEECILRLEKLMSVTDPESDISAVNRSAGSAVKVSAETAEVIAAGLKFGDITGGALDITVYPVLREWGFTTDREQNSIPSEGILGSLLENVGFENVSAEGCQVTIPEGYMLDLGAVAKGYTSDKVIDTLRENGVYSAIISLGGNVKTLGVKPSGKPWVVAVKSPFGGEPVGVIELTGEKAVVTSGGYERFFTGADGKVYHHIIDPADGHPADSGLASVTIISDSGLVCDALSTGLFVAGTDRAADIWRSRGDFDMILVTDAGKVLYTAGIADSFRAGDDVETELISRE